MKIRDSRKDRFFKIDNEIVDRFRLSPLAIAVYVHLARYADNVTQEAFLSVGSLAKKWVMGRSTVRKGFKELVEAKLILPGGRSKGYLATEYTLLDVVIAGVADHGSIQTMVPDRPGPGPIQTMPRPNTDHKKDLKTTLQSKTKEEAFSFSQEPEQVNLNLHMSLFHQETQKLEKPGWLKSSYSREMRALKEMIGEVGEAQFNKMRDAFFEKLRSNDRFWSAQPCKPSALKALWDRVKDANFKAPANRGGYRQKVWGGR